MQIIGGILFALGFICFAIILVLAYKGTYFREVKELALIKKAGHVEKHTAPKAKENIYRKEAIRNIERPRSMDAESRKILEEVENSKVVQNGGSETSYFETEDTSDDLEKSPETPNNHLEEHLDETSVLPGTSESTSVLNSFDNSTAVLDNSDSTDVLNASESTSVLNDDNGTEVLSYSEDISDDASSERTALLNNDEYESTSILSENNDTEVLDENIENEKTEILDQKSYEGTALLDQDENTEVLKEETSFLEDDDIPDIYNSEKTSEDESSEKTALLSDESTALLDDDETSILEA